MNAGRERLESGHRAHAIRIADRSAARRLPSARGSHAAAVAGRIRRPAALARCRAAASSAADGRRCAFDGALGTAGKRQDHACAARGPVLQGAVHRAVGRRRRRQGHPRSSGRGTCVASGGRAADRPVSRRGASLQQGAAGHVPAIRRGRHARLHRRDHRESVVRAELGAPVPRARLPAEAALRLPSSRPSSSGRSPIRTAVLGASALQATPEAIALLADAADGDARRALNLLEVAADLAVDAGDARALTHGDRARGFGRRSSPLRQARRALLRPDLCAPQVRSRQRPGCLALLAVPDAGRRLPIPASSRAGSCGWRARTSAMRIRARSR